MDYINYVKQSPMSMSGMGGPVGALNFHSGASAAWYGVRGQFWSGIASTWTNRLDYITIASTGNATSIGNLGTAAVGNGGTSDGSRGVFGGGKKLSPNVEVTTMMYNTIMSGGLSTFGDLTQARRFVGACCDGTRGVWAGGSGPGTDTMDYVTIQTTGNAQDFGDLPTNASDGPSGGSNGTRGIYGHAGAYACGQNEAIRYMTIATTGNATNFGDMTEPRGEGESAAADKSGDRLVMGPGCDTTTRQRRMDYVTISTTGNATEFGNLSANQKAGAGVSDGSRGVFGGSQTSPRDRINYITILSTSNGSDFGNLSQGRYGVGGNAGS